MPTDSGSKTASNPKTPGRVSGAMQGCGILLGLFGRDLGRAIAVFGGLLTGFTTLRWAITEKYILGGEFRMFAVAALAFVLTGWVCSRD